MDCLIFVFRDAINQAEIPVSGSIQIPFLMDAEPDAKGVVCL